MKSIELQTKAKLLVEDLIRKIESDRRHNTKSELVLKFVSNGDQISEIEGFIRRVEHYSSVGVDENAPRVKLAPDFAQQELVPECMPLWNGRELYFAGKVVKRYRNPGPNQQRVLEAFQEEKWPSRIDNPLSASESVDAQSRLSDTIKSLNRNHQHPLIRFRGDGTGKGVVWGPTRTNSANP